jgi:hypothetical protein
MRAGAFGLKAAIAFAAFIGFGAVVTQPAGAVPVSCSTIDTFGEWETASNAPVDPGCLDGDKVYILEDIDNIDPATEVEFQNFQDETHIVIQHLDVDGPLELSLQYTIQALESEIIFAGVDVDVSGADGTEVTKVLEDINGDEIATLLSVDGVPDDTTGVPFSEDFLRIIETISIADGAHVSSVSNEFRQAIPEPTTLALFGLGLAGLGLMRPRRAG